MHTIGRFFVVGSFTCMLLVFCNVTNKIRKYTDTAVAFTQEYSRISYPLRNMSTLSKDTHAGVEKTEEMTFYI